jgi:hypothetical protein
MPEQPLHVLMRAGKEVVDADDMCAELDEPLAKVRAEETGSPGYKHAFFEMHCGPGVKTRATYRCDRGLST